MPWAKNTGCESQWFGGDWGGSNLVPWSASSTPSTNTTGVMNPGTYRVRARHTQGALFLEVRQGAETAQSCNVNNSPATCPPTFTNRKAFLLERRRTAICALILCQQASWKSLSALGTKKENKKRDRGNFQNNIHFVDEKRFKDMLLHPWFYTRANKAASCFCLTENWMLETILYGKFASHCTINPTSNSSDTRVRDGLFSLHFNFLFWTKKKECQFSKYNLLCSTETIYRVCNDMRLRVAT